MTATTRHDRAPQRVAFDVVLRGCLPATVASGALTSLVLAVARGASAGLAGLVGTTIAAAFFASGLVVMSRFAVDQRNPAVFMAVGMATYVAQTLVLLGVLVVAWRLPAFDTFSAGVAMAVAVLVWQVAQVRAWRRARMPLYDDVRLPSARPTPSEEAR